MLTCLSLHNFLNLLNLVAAPRAFIESSEDLFLPILLPHNHYYTHQLLDTSKLIEENELTLMGRLTNPPAERLWSLFLFLANRWNLRGKAIGSDLGKCCFQFRFDYEEDF